MDWKDALYCKNPDYVFRNIENECVLIPIKRSGAEVDALFTLNEVAARIWDLVDGNITGKGIVDRIVDEYEVNEKVAEDDIRTVLRQLEEIGGIGTK